ncbi:MAG: PQ-loop repeat-containing protein [Halioglobus sp.]|nr:PQ-loop repeat-containing protein [Halioglobus sp.]
MTNEQLALVANILQLSVIAISLLAFVPQWRHILRSRSSEGLSHSTWYLWNLATIFGFVYALINYRITGWGMSLIVATGVNVIFRMITLSLVLIFQVKREATASEASIPRTRRLSRLG